MDTSEETVIWSYSIFKVHKQFKTF